MNVLVSYIVRQTNERTEESGLFMKLSTIEGYGDWIYTVDFFSPLVVSR